MFMCHKNLRSLLETFLMELLKSNYIAKLFHVSDRQLDQL